MKKRTKSPIKIIGLFLTVLLLFSSNINGVLSAGNLAPKPTNTRTPTPTSTPTRTPSNTPTNTFTNTPITYTPTATSTPGPGMQLVSLSPNLTQGLYSSYTLDSSPQIGVSTNELYTWMTVSGTTSSTGDFSRATFIPAIKNTRSTTYTFYWAAWFQVTGFSDIVQAHFGWDHEFRGGYLVTGSGTISPNGTWRPDIGIVKKNLSTCAGCPYTLYTTIHFTEKNLYPSPFTSTPMPTATSTHTVTPTLTPTATYTPSATPSPSGLINAYRFDTVANSGAYSAIITGDPSIRTDQNGEWSYMRVAVQRIIGNDVYYAEIGWLKGAQSNSNYVPRVYWTYRDINGFVDEGWGGYPGVGLAYNYKVKQTSSKTWGLYFNDPNIPLETAWVGWIIADDFFSGGEVPNANQGMGDSDNNNVQYLDPMSGNWVAACNTLLDNGDPSKYFVDAGGNCSSWRVYGNN